MIRKALLALLVLFALVSPVVAQPTIGDISTLNVADQSEETVTLENVSANSAIVVFYSKASTSNRSVSSIVDDASPSSNTYTSIYTLGTCSSARCIEVFADYNVNAATSLTITLTQSSTFVNYFLFAIELKCAGTCAQGGQDGLINSTSNTDHECSAGSTVIDTDPNAALLIYAQAEAGGNWGTDSPPSSPVAWTEIADGNSSIYAAYLDTYANAFTDQRGAWTSSSAATPHCVIVAVVDSGSDSLIVSELQDINTNTAAIAASTDAIAEALSPDAVHDNAVIATGPQIVAEAKTFDGAALPNNVAEGDAVRVAATERGVVYVIPVTSDGAQSPQKIDDAGFTQAASAVMVAAGVADTTPDSVDEDDAAALRLTLDRKLVVTAVPHSSQGLDVKNYIDLDEGAGEVVKNSAGQLFGIWIANTATATRYVKFYNATSCTMGSGGAPFLTIPVPGNSSDDKDRMLSVGGLGIYFNTGICVGATTGVADSDTGAPGTNDVIVNIFYK